MRVMGVDLGIKKVAFSIWEDDTLIFTAAYESMENDRADQLEDMSNVLGDEVAEWKPDHVFIEETLIGNNRSYSIKLAQMMGAVLANLSILRREHMFGIYLANVQTWKKKVIGTGNANKEIIKDYLTQLNPAYAELCGSDQDQYDAACIGLYGVNIANQAGELVLDDVR